ncbi:hypothetical protein M440DRAFT_1464357 [Trichoderma longibrachiatum ATCC 18648]|uniref:Carbohydrate kinase FGGY C-terminal domain-containing protein n=1 Tax=Trichoderma longibrachiatum ATCC 18648 TaxID=983965 RepID=A0A2T4BY88_TRILO|nr:hypothetical protein M440DRAFT_1464357 [Trichoderma longibrachiatum ATCC 18648]
MSEEKGPLYLGFDLSTQQLKAIVVNSNLKSIAEAKVDFDQDFGPQYGIQKGVHVREATGEVFAPVALWLESLDLVLSRLAKAMHPLPMSSAVAGGVDELVAGEPPQDGTDLQEAREAWPKEADARAIVESQALSMRLRSQKLVHSPRDGLPAQPRRIYVVGGGSLNPAITRVLGEVLGGADGVYKLDVGGNACALGGAYKALWALERKDGETFDDLIGERWTEEGSIEKVDVGYREGTYERYGKVLGAFEEMERRLLAEEEH